MLKRRRRTIAVIVVVVAGSMLAAYAARDDGDGVPGLQRQGARDQGDEGGAGDIPIKHVVFIVKENRTFDNYFGRYPGADGATHGKVSTGERIPLAPAKDVLDGDLGHGFLSGVKSI